MLFRSIVGFSEIVVQDGGCLREHQTPKTLFNNVGTVTIAKGGTLDLLQTNEITGAFTTAGTLKMPKPVSAERDTVYFIVTGTVAVSEEDGRIFRKKFLILHIVKKVMILLLKCRNMKENHT